jgi:hypothetical protein
VSPLPPEGGSHAIESGVGNAMWVRSLRDPDWCRIDFESKTDEAEESKFDE